MGCRREADAMTSRHTNLASILDGVMAHQDGEPSSEERRTTGGRRRKEKKRLSKTDGRVRRGLGRNRQWNTNVTQELIDMAEDECDRFDLTKAEWTERAFRFYAKHLEAGTAD